MNKEQQYNKLITSAQQIFLTETAEKLKKISKKISNRSYHLTRNDNQEIIRFFHSLIGTASTLGFDFLSSIAIDYKSKLKTLIENENNQEEKNTIKKAFAAVKEELNNILKRQQQNKNSDLNSNKYDDFSNSYGTILLIDDNITILTILEQAFDTEGYTVYICDDPLESMDMIELSKPDVILLDIMMPKCNGYEILSQIKANPKYRDICVIFLSAIDDIEGRMQGMKSGVDDYITKPFNIEEVVTRIEMILRRANKFKEKLLKDQLTKAYSRHFFNERLNKELERYKRNSTLFSIAFIDLDFFKDINDNYGHTTGDYVLRQFVSFAKDNLRNIDCIFRFGGEEFIVLLPDTNENQAFTAIDRLREKFSDTKIEHSGNTINLTFSSGIAEVTGKDKSVSRLVRRADKALYKAKNTGRNKVVKFKDMYGKDFQDKKTVLLVDDESTILKMLKERLYKLGYNILTAENGKKALESANKKSVNAVVLDLILPDMDGLEICRKLKANNTDIKILILSQKNAEEDIVTGLKCGADDYVTKPFSLKELEVRINKLFHT